MAPDMQSIGGTGARPFRQLSSSAVGDCFLAKFPNPPTLYGALPEPGGSAWQAWHCIGSCLFGIVTGSSRCIGEGQRPDCMDRYGHRPLCTAAAVSCRPAASCCVRPAASCCVRPAASYCMRPACRSLFEARVPLV